MVCIFCLQEKPASSEHVLPDALGGTLQIDRVCRVCNNWLGANVDVKLTEHRLALFGRSMNSIGDQTALLSKIFGPGTINAGEDKVDVIVKGELTEGADGKQAVPVPRVASRVFKEVATDGTRSIRAHFDASQEEHARALIRAEFKRLGYEFSEEEFERRYEEVVTRSSTQVVVHHEMAIDLVQYRLPILKIVYELAWRWLGDEWLGTPIAKLMRDLVMGKTAPSEADIQGTVNLYLDNWPLTMLDEEAMHSAGIMATSTGTVLCLRIFRSFFAVVKVSDDVPKDIQTDPLADGKIIRFFKNQTWEEQSLSDAVLLLVAQVNN
jgi:HNH endonuclease